MEFQSTGQNSGGGRTTLAATVPLSRAGQCPARGWKARRPKNNGSAAIRPIQTGRFARMEKSTTGPAGPDRLSSGLSSGFSLRTVPRRKSGSGGRFPTGCPISCLFGGVLVSTGWQEVQIACRGWSAGHVKSRPSFNCRSSVFSGCLVKQPRAMAPVGRASQSVAKSDSLCFTAGYGQG